MTSGLSPVSILMGRIPLLHHVPDAIQGKSPLAAVAQFAAVLPDALQLCLVHGAAQQAPAGRLTFPRDFLSPERSHAVVP